MEAARQRHHDRARLCVTGGRACLLGTAVNRHVDVQRGDSPVGVVERDCAQSRSGPALPVLAPGTSLRTRRRGSAPRFPRGATAVSRPSVCPIWSLVPDPRFLVRPVNVPGPRSASQHRCAARRRRLDSGGRHPAPASHQDVPVTQLSEPEVHLPEPVTHLPEPDDSSLGAGVISARTATQWHGFAVRHPEPEVHRRGRGLRDASSEETRTPDSETRTPDSETRTPDSETRTPDSETRTPDSETRAPDSETRTPDSETRTPDSETRTLDSETRTPDSETRTLDSALATGDSVARIRDSSAGADDSEAATGIPLHRLFFWAGCSRP